MRAKQITILGCLLVGLLGSGTVRAADPEPQEQEAAAEPEHHEEAAAAEGETAEGEEAGHPGDMADSADAPITDEEGVQVPTDPKAYGAYVRQVMDKAKAKTLTLLTGKIEAKQKQTMGRVALAFFLFSLLGLLLLLMPFFLIKKHPGKLGVLFKYSALAAVTFFVAVNLFSGVIMLMRTAQGLGGKWTNPQIAVATATFDTLYDNADELAGARNVLQPTFDQLMKGGEDGEGGQELHMALLENASKMKGQVQTFMSMKNLFKKVDWIFAALPIVLTLLALFLFVLASRDVLLEIIRLPGRAASGEAGAGSAVLRSTFKRIASESLATICLIGVVLAVSLVSGLAIGIAIKPAAEALIGEITLAMTYVQLPGMNPQVITLSLVGAALFLALTVAVYVVGAAFFMGKTQKLFQRRFHEKLPLRANARFWKWGIAALLTLLVIPVVYAFGIELLLDKLIDGMDDGDPTRMLRNLLIIMPAVMIVGYLVFFWAARGMTAMRFLFRYPAKPPKQAKQPAGEAVAA